MFFNKKQPSLSESGYPTPADAMPDDWVECAEALGKALRELGVTASVEARNNGEPGSDLLVVFFRFFVVMVDTYEDRWVLGLPNPETGEQEWFDDFKGFSNLPARAIAILVVSRSLVFFMQLMDVLSKVPDEAKKDFQVDQALLFELIRASTSASIPGHWKELNPETPEAEDHFLTMLGQAAKENSNRALAQLGIDFSELN